MKKLFAVILAIILCMSFAACGTTSTPETVEFPEVLVVNNEECSIRITGVEPDTVFGYAVLAHLENKSTEKTYMFTVENMAINGVQVLPLWANEVTPGNKANSKIVFDEDSLKAAGIDKYTDIEITFRVYDSDDWLTDDVALETVHIYPYGESAATKFNRDSLATDIVIIDNEYFTAVVLDYEPGDFFGFAVNLFLVNKTDKEVMFGVSDAALNGLMVDPYFATTVAANKCTFSSIRWLDTMLEGEGITDVDKVEFSVRIYDFNDWAAGDFVNEVITLTP